MRLKIKSKKTSAAALCLTLSAVLASAGLAFAGESYEEYVEVYTESSAEAVAEQMLWENPPLVQDPQADGIPGQAQDLQAGDISGQIQDPQAGDSWGQAQDPQAGDSWGQTQDLQPETAAQWSEEEYPQPETEAQWSEEEFPQQEAWDAELYGNDAEADTDEPILIAPAEYEYEQETQEETLAVVPVTSTDSWVVGTWIYLQDPEVQEETESYTYSTLEDAIELSQEDLGPYLGIEISMTGFEPGDYKISIQSLYDDTTLWTEFYKEETVAILDAYEQHYGKTVRIAFGEEIPDSHRKSGLYHVRICITSLSNGSAAALSKDYFAHEKDEKDMRESYSIKLQEYPTMPADLETQEQLLAREAAEREGGQDAAQQTPDTVEGTQTTPQTPEDISGGSQDAPQSPADTAEGPETTPQSPADTAQGSETTPPSPADTAEGGQDNPSSPSDGESSGDTTQGENGSDSPDSSGSQSEDNQDGTGGSQSERPSSGTGGDGYSYKPGQEQEYKPTTSGAPRGSGSVTSTESISGSGRMESRASGPSFSGSGSQSGSSRSASSESGSSRDGSSGKSESAPDSSDKAMEGLGSGSLLFARDSGPKDTVKQILKEISLADLMAGRHTFDPECGIGTYLGIMSRENLPDDEEKASPEDEASLKVFAAVSGKPASSASTTPPAAASDTTSSTSTTPPAASSDSSSSAAAGSEAANGSGYAGPLSMMNAESTALPENAPPLPEGVTQQ